MLGGNYITICTVLNYLGKRCFISSYVFILYENNQCHKVVAHVMGKQETFTIHVKCDGHLLSFCINLNKITILYVMLCVSGCYYAEMEI